MIQIFHFHNGTGGGVISVIRNLLLYNQNNEIENHVIYTINKEQFESFEILKLTGATTEKIFYYSPKWNFYYTCSQLSKYLPNDSAIIVAHDWLELGMVSNLGLKNTVIQVLHGDFQYYYDLSILHFANINRFICVSKIIENRLKELIPNRRNEITYLRFPIPNFKKSIKEVSKIRCIFFVRNLNDERKQAFLLPQIEMKLIEKGIKIEWHIAGGGMSSDEFKLFWGFQISDNVKFYGSLNESKINQLLNLCNVMILPSVSEGFPVALVEGMKNGLVPLISYWGGAVSDLVVDGYNGFYFKIQDSESYANILQYLSLNSSKLSDLSNRATEDSNRLYDPFINTISWEYNFQRARDFNILTKTKFKAYGSMLDCQYLPNGITFFLRKLKYH